MMINNSSSSAFSIVATTTVVISIIVARITGTKVWIVAEAVEIAVVVAIGGIIMTRAMEGASEIDVMIKEIREIMISEVTKMSINNNNSSRSSSSSSSNNRNSNTNNRNRTVMSKGKISKDYGGMKMMKTGMMRFLWFRSVMLIHRKKTDQSRSRSNTRSNSSRTNRNIAKNHKGMMMRVKKVIRRNHVSMQVENGMNHE